jgi:DNA-binding NtrC family response regulator
VRKGTFRLDLFYRLRVLHIDLPPLRERNDDVAALAHHFLRRVAESQNKPVRQFAPDVLKRLTSYPWPGNVRELANVIEREVSLLPATATILARFEVPLGGASGVSDSWAPETPTSGKMKAVRVTGEASLLPNDILPLTEVERRAYLDAYAAFGGNVTRASKALGVSKVTFYAKLRQWGMHPSDEPGPETLRKIKIAERAEDGGDE